MAIHPMETARALEDTYRSYLQTTFAFRDTVLGRQFEGALLKPGSIVKGPYLEATPPFVPGRSLEELCQAGLLEKGLGEINPEELKPYRKFYAHQENAIIKLANGKNLVVATGTGSGKTECFLVPILNHLLREKREGYLDAGVRALLVYPMNALANDQLGRLRKLLAKTPDITFGRFTGDTHRDPAKARELFLKENPKAEMLPNERLSRDEMVVSPPHILITNFAMLEFMLLRPSESPFFDPPFNGNWKFLVLDEAHTYGGAKGAEISMLIRRLKQRVVGGRQGVLQCIATSATLGRGAEDAVEVAEFASHLFGESFEWDPRDTRRQDVVFSQRIPAASIPASPIWKIAGVPYYEALSKWFTEIRQGTMDGPPDFLEEAGVPTEVHTTFSELVDPVKVEVAATSLEQGARTSAPEDDPLGQGLYYLLRHDPKISELRSILAEGPIEPLQVAGRLWSHLPGEVALAELVNLVDLAIWAKPGEGELPLLSARYHFFATALEGAFLSFVPEIVLTLNREIQREGAVFEIALCDECGQLYLAGHIGGNGVLEQPRAGVEGCDYFLVADNLLDPDNDDEDERVLVDQSPGRSAEGFFLCPWCGRTQSEVTGACCEANKPKRYVRLWRITRSKSGLSRCGSCGTRAHDPIRRIITGRDAPVAVLSSTLYENIKEGPAQKVSLKQEESRSHYTGRSSKKTLPSKHERKLLVFSDSRQEAAYFGWFLGATHADILWRRAILHVIRQLESRSPDLMVSDIIDPLTKMCDEAGLLDEQGTPIEKQKQTWRYVMREFWVGPRVAGLESVGSLAFMPHWDGFEIPTEGTPLQEYPWNLDPNETYDFWNSLLDQFRIRGAVKFPDLVAPTDEFFSPRNREVYMRQKGAEKLGKSGVVYGWLPTKGQNGRFDLVARALSRRGLEDRHIVEETLAGTWEMIEVLAEETSIIERFTHKSAAVVYYTNPDGWRITTNARWGQCERCGTITSRPYLGVCPMYRCNGSIAVIDPDVSLGGQHYRRLYNVDMISPMRVEEHTAQLSSQAATALQKQFEEGKVNVLSCSTTFEMGVDVGELEAVILRNVPPEPANYIQRAGRAGRRASNTAFTLTYAQRRSHDATFYSDPPKMITGEIRPPSITLRNEKIMLRHLYAVALAWYFHKNSSRFENFSGLERIMPEDAPYSVIADLHEELSKHPRDLLEAIQVILPHDMQVELGVHSWDWVDAFASPEAEDCSVLYTAIELLQADLDYIEEVRTRRITERKPIDNLERLRSTLLGRDVISFLSSKSALPKYGFPVDVVALEILSHDKKAMRLELERDLRLAIGDYAPGSEVVAGGYVWTSYALKKPPRRDWEQRRYVLCDTCHTYTESLKVEDGGDPVVCEGCGAEIARQRTYVIPSYGFVTKAETRLARPRQTRPIRAHTSRVYFSHFDDPTPFSDEKRGHSDFASGRLEWMTSSLGHLAVINTGPMDGGYRICSSCGFAEPLLSSSERKKSHHRPFGGECEHPYFFVAGLGHNFATDVLELRFPLPYYDYSFWLSMTYALLEGSATALGIARGDIDGCVYVAGGTPSTPSIILFDDVPGGAGHVRRLASERALREVLHETILRVDNCKCGEDTSCYGCLRNYRNQWCHHELKRGAVAQYLKGVVGMR